MFSRTDNILQNIAHNQFEYEEYFVGLIMFHIQFVCENILQNTICPAKHCYGSE